MIRAAVIFLALAVAAAAAELNPAHLVDQIRAVENWRGRDGAAGERGPYQITPAVWRDRMPGQSFTLARQEGPGRACALKQIEWLRQGLLAAGWPATAYNIALAWNAGLERTLQGRALTSSRNYAQRVSNLYASVP